MGTALVPSAVAACPLRLVLGLGLALGACKPGIGDACTTSTDCSQSGDRLCDISQPNGYCTIFNCEPAGTNAASKCPDDSACIAFAAEPSPLEECANALGATPYQRTFCLRKCDRNSDCRDGYVCKDPEEGGKFAVDVDGTTKVCLVAPDASPPPGDASTEVCTGSSNAPDADSDMSTAGAGPSGDMSSGGGASGGGGSP